MTNDNSNEWRIKSNTTLTEVVSRKKSGPTSAKCSANKGAVKLKVPLLDFSCCTFEWTTKPYFPWCCSPRKPVLPPLGPTTCSSRIWGPYGLCDSLCPPLRCLPHTFMAEAVNHYVHAYSTYSAGSSRIAACIGIHFVSRDVTHNHINILQAFCGHYILTVGFLKIINNQVGIFLKQRNNGKWTSERFAALASKSGKITAHARQFTSVPVYEIFFTGYISVVYEVFSFP